MTNEQRATRQAQESLEGRRIVAVRYVNTHEAEELCWRRRGIVLELDDGSVLVASADEEMNDAGVLLLERGGQELCFGRFPT